jgi:hypothetical protein
MKRKAYSNLAARVERLQKSPQFPNIDPHDLEMILTSLQRTRRERMQLMFLKKGKAAMSFDESFLEEFLCDRLKPKNTMTRVDCWSQNR